MSVSKSVKEAVNKMLENCRKAEASSTNMMFDDGSEKIIDEFVECIKAHGFEPTVKDSVITVKFPAWDQTEDKGSDNSDDDDYNDVVRNLKKQIARAEIDIESKIRLIASMHTDINKDDTLDSIKNIGFSTIGIDAKYLALHIEHRALLANQLDIVTKLHQEIKQEE